MTLLWFRNDLRLHDNEAIDLAARLGDTLLPVYIFDPREFEHSYAGLPKTGPYRLQFVLDSLAELRTQLKARGSELIVLEGKPESIIPDLCGRLGADHVLYQREVTYEETRVEEALTRALATMPVEIVAVWGSTLFHLEDLPLSLEDIPDVFTAFRKRVEKECTVRERFPAPDRLPPVPDGAPSGRAIELRARDRDDDTPTDTDESPNAHREPIFGVAPANPSKRGVLEFTGGERSGLWRLNEYFWERDRLRVYKKTRNGMLGADYSSKFSPWIARGCLSPRLIYEEVKRYEREREKNTSTYWLIFELMWRDYFRFTAMKHGDRLFSLSGFHGKEIRWSRDTEQFAAWSDGRTGIPFIDANMRELNETGYMSNRGRQNVASFLAKCLGIDWRWGAGYFESMLIDYDVCSNWGNWAYNAGVGNDPRDRYFDIVNQANRYDAKGKYVRHWVPELASVPDEYIHQPHLMTDAQQTHTGVNIGIDYPRPILDLEAAYRRIRDGQ